MIYLLDTDTLSTLMRPVVPDVLMTKLASKANEDLSTSTITLGEIIYGACRMPSRRERILEAMDSILPTIRIVSFDVGAARRYGELRAELELRGEPIGDADTRIASIALAGEMTIVTANLRHFGRVPGLAVENWLM